MCFLLTKDKPFLEHNYISTLLTIKEGTIETHLGSRLSLLDCSVVACKSEPLLLNTGGSVVTSLGCSVETNAGSSHVAGTTSSKVSGTYCFEFPGSGSSVVCLKDCHPFMLKLNYTTILKMLILTLDKIY